MAKAHTPPPRPRGPAPNRRGVSVNYRVCRATERARVPKRAVSGRGPRPSGRGSPRSERSRPLRNLDPTRLGNPPRHPPQGCCRRRCCQGQSGTATLRKHAFSCGEAETCRNPEDAAKAREHASERRSAKIGSTAFVASSPAIPTTRPVPALLCHQRSALPFKRPYPAWSSLLLHPDHNSAADRIACLARRGPVRSVSRLPNPR